MQMQGKRQKHELMLQVRFKVLGRFEKLKLSDNPIMKKAFNYWIKLLAKKTFARCVII